MNNMRVYFYYGVISALIIALPFILSKFKSLKNRLFRFAITVFTANVLWMFPRYFLERADLGDGQRFFNSLAYSVYNSVLIFGLGGLMEDIRALKSLLEPSYISECGAYYIAGVAALFYFLGSVVTVTAIISLFRDFYAKIKYLRKKFSILREKIYIFSELNERSIILASDIVENAKKEEGLYFLKRPIIVFCDVFNQNSESSYELREQALNIGAICFKMDITSIDWLLLNVFNNKSLNLFLIGDSEDENLEQSIKLIETYNVGEKSGAEQVNNKNKSKKSLNNKITLYLFSKSSTSELSIHSLLHKDSSVNIIRIDYKRSMIYNYLYEHGADVINTAMKSERGEKQFEMLILGMGEHGIEMIKSLLWFCRRDKYKLKINVYDKEDNLQEKLYAQCPGIEELNKENELISFHTADFCLSSFYENTLGNHPDASFVFISLGDDSKNIAIAKKTREFFARNILEQADEAVIEKIKQAKEEKNVGKNPIMKKPIITTVVENSEVKDALKKDGYNISIIGDFKKVYSKDVVINSDLESLAYAVHSSTRKKDNSNKKNDVNENISIEDITDYDKTKFYKEYCYRSTIAQVIYHLAWKKTCSESAEWSRMRADLINNAAGSFGAVIDGIDAINKTLNDIVNKFEKHCEKEQISSDEEMRKKEWESFIVSHSDDKGVSYKKTVERCHNKLEEFYSELNEKISRYEICFSNEKTRWNYYELTEGFEEYLGSQKNEYALKQFKDELHRHTLIKPFDKLSGESKNDLVTQKPLLSEKQGEAKYFAGAYRIINE